MGLPYLSFQIDVLRMLIESEPKINPSNQYNVVLICFTYAAVKLKQSASCKYSI